MSDRSRRQKRLLAVRELQAELAAAQLRALRSRQEELRNDLAHWQGLVQTPAPAASPAHGQWLLACAEKEIAALRAEGVVVQMEAQAVLMEAQASEEKERRIAREQMQRLCDHADAVARTTGERTLQGRLDDIFSAARLRRLAEAMEP